MYIFFDYYHLLYIALNYILSFIISHWNNNIIHIYLNIYIYKYTYYIYVL